ncbi:TonB-denpendent receptor [Sphingobium indicum IP26]|uniref:Porin n=1 Tax=Sphingobium indicum F2 TaxID=1450518 RepID=A0A8E1C2T4_9SPHN|nr:MULTISPECIES: TonB-dependent siderophore receptor [Sphingobium]EPR16949.1 TonB-denpendent receptor [Sphingobium indicum IP26]EQB04605.1 TonB-denpendent receptor [Sphingobium sp. HDIP04]KER36534.1 porin [Sphingobium indicum F2]
MKSIKSLLLGSVAMSFCAAAQAQEAAPGSDDQGAIVVTGTYTLDHSIDTATGLGLALRETPQSVSVMTAQRILDQNLITVKDVIQNGVGVAVNEVDDVRNSFYARGFEIRNTQIDGVPAAWTLAGANGETSADVSIYERVEIVRGATGLLSGAGDPSASVNLVRKHADFADFKGYLNAGVGSWDSWRLSADLGGALTPDGRVRARVVGRYERGKSYIDIQDRKKWVLYGVVEADVTDSTLVRAGISHQDTKPSGATWGALPTFYSDGTTTFLPRSQTTAADWTYWNTTNQNIFATVRQAFGERWSLTVNYNRLKNSGDTQLLYLYGNVNKATGTIDSSNPYKSTGESVQESFDGQLKGEVSLFGRDHEVVLGALHSILNRHTDNFVAPYTRNNPAWGAGLNDWANNVPLVGEVGVPFPEPVWGTTPVRNEQERIKQTGYYAAVRLNIADPFKVVGGGRLASWHQTGFAWSGPSDYGNDDVFIPYVGALLDVTPNHRLYASYTRIFQPQNLLDRNLRQLDPLNGNAFEIGLKSSFFGDKFQTSIALFQIKQDNVGQPDIMVTPPGGGLPQQTYVAAEGITSKGVELEATGQLLPGWNVNASYSRFWADYSNGAPANTDQPRKLLKVFTTYSFPVLGRDLTLGGGVNYRGVAYSTGANPVTLAPFRFTQGAYTLVSVMARYNITDQVEIQANVENLLDKTYFSQVGFYSQYRYGAPRNFTVGATYRF